MTIEQMVQYGTQAPTLLFAFLVWQELRSFRSEVMTLLTEAIAKD